MTAIVTPSFSSTVTETELFCRALAPRVQGRNPVMSRLAIAFLLTLTGTTANA